METVPGRKVDSLNRTIIGLKEGSRESSLHYNTSLNRTIIGLKGSPCAIVITSVYV